MKCESCDKNVQSSWSYCPYCGIKLPFYQNKNHKGILAECERAYPEHLILINSGYYYHGWSQSAIALSLMFNYKLNTSSKNGFVWTGFPSSNLNTKLEQLKEFNVNYICVDHGEIIYEYNDGIQLSNFIEQHK